MDLSGNQGKCLGLLADMQQDLTIVAVAIPSLTDYFGKVNDIGWYSAA